MNPSALQLSEPQSSITAVWRTADAILAQRSAIVRLMQEVMKPNIDYGKIPGTPKPTLYKPGSEKLLSMFRLNVKPEVEDLSTPDTIRYRVRVVIADEVGNFVGADVGEASSAESKYQWRKVVCQEEWDATPEDRRRIKWAKSATGSYSTQQVRTEMEDVANTVLKMAKKRAQIAATLTVTACSDVFSQDAEDLKAAGIDAGEEQPDGASPDPAATRPTELPKKTDAQPRTTSAQAPAPAQPTQAGAQPPHGPTINEAQQRRFYAIWKQAGKTKDQVREYLRETFGIDNDRELLIKDYETACAWAVTR